jgi:hypothetical protein
MAGLLLTPSLINQNWGNAALALAQDLAVCNGINTLINDTGRLPRTGGQTSADALVAVGISAADAPLLVSTFGDLAALYRIAHGQQQQVGNNDFFFSARQLLGTQPMP